MGGGSGDADGGGGGEAVFLWPEVAPVASYVWGHGLLKCSFDSPSHRGRWLTFCYRCGAYCTDFRPGVVLKGKCKGMPASPGIKSQLGRIRSGKHPLYRKSTRDLILSLPGPLSSEEREAMRQAILFEAATGSASSPLRSTHEAPGFAPEETVLQAFGLLASELPRVQALGEAARRGGSEEDSDPKSDGGDLF